MSDPSPHPEATPGKNPNAWRKGLSVWIFGYGSLLWRPDFPFLEMRKGYVCGWRRRFYQGSTDHRGTPAFPGRVVTLEPHAGSRCWGAAYRVAGEAEAVVLGQLDEREKGGYDRIRVDFWEDSSTKPLPVLVYLATPENPNFLGPAPADQMAHQILRASGPSGTNLEYLFKLSQSLRRMDATDPHVFALETRVRSLLTLEGGPPVYAD